MDSYWSIDRCGWAPCPGTVGDLPVPVAAHGLERPEAAVAQDVPGQRQPAAVPVDH